MRSAKAASASRRALCERGPTQCPSSKLKSVVAHTHIFQYTLVLVRFFSVVPPCECFVLVLLICFPCCLSLLLVCAVHVLVTLCHLAQVFDL